MPTWKRPEWKVLLLVLCIFLTACGPENAKPAETPTATANVSQESPTAVGFPQTEVSCPASKQARAAIMPATAQATRDTLVYLYNDGSLENPVSSVIRRYDVHNNMKKDLVTFERESISEAQVKNDWVVFVHNGKTGQSMLQMVRSDGQGLQTLYCGEQYPPGSIGLYQLEWSQDAKRLVFLDGRTIATATAYLLDLEKGSVQAIEGVKASATSGNRPFVPAGWIDEHMMLWQRTTTDTGAPLEGVYTMNMDQLSTPPVKLAEGLDPGYSFDTSIDGKQLLLAQNMVRSIQPNLDIQGPSSISTIPITGGTPQQIISHPLAVRSMRVLSKSSILFAVGNTQGDINQNGIWKVNLDAQGVQKLAAINLPAYASFNEDSLDYVSNFTRDSLLYAVRTSQIAPYQEQTIWYGSVNGGNLLKVAHFPGGFGSLKVVGWSKIAG